MTAYVVSVSTSVSIAAGSTASPILFALSPVLFEIKLLQIEYTLTAVGDSSGSTIVPYMIATPSLYRYSSGVASSGTSVTPVALRQGAPAPSTTARWGTGVSVSGTQTYVASPEPIKAAELQDLGKTFTLPFDFTIPVGGVLLFTTGGIGAGGAVGATNSCRVQAILYFEEFALSWPY